MPKYRQLHTKIIDSFDFNEMPDDLTRVVWLLLTLILDSEGRGIDNMNWVKSNMFPMREDMTPELLDAPFDWLAGKKMIVRYEANCRKYFYIPTFKDYQTGTKKEAPSLLPPPPDELQSNSRVSTEQVVAAVSASALYLHCIESESALTAEIFKAYEREIGNITKTIGDEIDEAIKEYPAEWFPLVFAEAAKNNKRSWAYARAILKRWKAEGPNTSSKKSDGAPEIR
jgi:DnaD/phage-associated family protein